MKFVRVSFVLGKLLGGGGGAPHTTSISYSAKVCIIRCLLLKYRLILLEVLKVFEELLGYSYYTRLLFSCNQLRQHLLIDPYLLTLRNKVSCTPELFRSVPKKVWPHNYNLDLNCFPYPMK